MHHKKQNILFVCYGNLNRSPTAADVCRKIVQEKNLQINVASAGIAVYSETPITKFIADDADIIFVMEDYMKKLLEDYYGQPHEKVICLDIPDIYARNAPELVALLEKELSRYLL
jgi:predicted protein tyrosine phosphatase